MTVTLATLEAAVYEIIGKSSSTYGFLTPTKIDSLINDAMKFISSEMIGSNATWMNKQAKLNIVASTDTITLPTDLAIITWVKKLSVSQYVPIQYSEDADVAVDTATATSADYTPTWRFREGKLALNPIPGFSQTNGIYLDYIAYPTTLSGAVDLNIQLEGDPFIQFIKWHAAEMAWQLTSESGAIPPPWSSQVTKWYNTCKKIIAKRNARNTTIVGFTNY